MMATKLVQIKYLKSQYNRNAWCSPSKIDPLFLALAAKKAKYEMLDLEKWMPKSSANNKECW